MREIKVKCKKCGDVKISGYFTEQSEEGFIVPVKLCPTIQSLGKYYKEIDGNSYEWVTGNKLSDGFKIETLEILHTNQDDDGEDWAEHTLEPLECWREQL